MGWPQDPPILAHFFLENLHCLKNLSAGRADSPVKSRCVCNFELPVIFGRSFKLSQERQDERFNLVVTP